MAENKKIGIYEKLMTVQLSLKAPKNQFNSFGKYYYRSCEDILEGLKPCLKEVKAAVTIDDEIVEIGGRVYVKASAHFHDAETGEMVNNTAYAREEETKSGMSAAQITGATSSYARKYALNGLFMIDDNKDADTDESKVESDAKSKAYKSKTTETKKTESSNPVESQVISDTKIHALMKKAEQDGVSVATILDKCKKPNLESLTEKQFAWVCSNWTEVFVNGK